MQLFVDMDGVLADFDQHMKPSLARDPVRSPTTPRWRRTQARLLSAASGT